MWSLYKYYIPFQDNLILGRIYNTSKEIQFFIFRELPNEAIDHISRVDMKDIKYISV